VGNLRFHTFSTLVRLGVEDALPGEFRLFVKGWNETENGRFLFDDAAAAAVMSAYRTWGVDLAIDLEHQMLGGVASDPTARDARGWCKLELREDGSLWATDVRWTPDGAARLTEKRQRYVSPAFEIDPKTKRVSKVLNIAITAMPATHNTPALVAASMGAGMDPKLVGQALDALEKGDAKAALEILKGLIASAAGGGADPDAATEDAPPPAGDGGADEATESAVPPAADDPTADEEKKAAVAAVSRLVRLSGKATLVAAVDEVETWRASHLELESERQKLAAERATLESAERRKLCVELVTLGAEFPATVWADDKATALKPRWTKMPIETLREHVSEQRAARGGKPAPGVKPPKPAASGDGSKEVVTSIGSVTLSAREIQACERAGAQLEVYAANKIRRSSAG